MQDEYLNTIQQLANGVNPITGEIFDEHHILQNATIARALMFSVKAIENEIKRQKRKTELPQNAGQPWTDDLDKELIEKYKNGLTIKELSEIFQRTSGSIQSRLVKHHGILNI